MHALLAQPWYAIATRLDPPRLLAHVDATGTPPVIATPPGLIAAMGPGWLAALLTEEVRGRVIALGDCGEDAGHALACLSLGLGVTAPEVVEAARPRLLAIGADLGLPVLFERRPLTLPGQDGHPGAGSALGKTPTSSSF